MLACQVEMHRVSRSVESGFLPALGEWWLGVNGEDKGECKYTMTITKYDCPMNCTGQGRCQHQENGTHTCLCNEACISLTMLCCCCKGNTGDERHTFAPAAATAPANKFAEEESPPKFFMSTRGLYLLQGFSTTNSSDKTFIQVAESPLSGDQKLERLATIALLSGSKGHAHASPFYGRVSLEQTAPSMPDRWSTANPCTWRRAALSTSTMSCPAYPRPC